MLTRFLNLVIFDAERIGNHFLFASASARMPSRSSRFSSSKFENLAHCKGVVVELKKHDAVGNPVRQTHLDSRTAQGTYGADNISRSFAVDFPRDSAEMVTWEKARR